ncbi:unnamed protein product [Amoebophrya sp. A25]|nr:unnamed protein product [Amoebophrya sp. A25]|eukprot:GSA25T00023848001.1
MVNEPPSLTRGGKPVFSATTKNSADDRNFRVVDGDSNVNNEDKDEDRPALDKIDDRAASSEGKIGQPPARLKDLRPSEAEDRKARFLNPSMNDPNWVPSSSGGSSSVPDELDEMRNITGVRKSTHAALFPSGPTERASSSTSRLPPLDLRDPNVDWTPEMRSPRWEKLHGANHVWLHVYDLDSFTEWLNESFLASNEMGAYHVGVEVYGDEWSFLFYSDVLDPTVTGCNRVQPREHPDFTYNTSIYMGRTPLGAMEVSRRLLVLMDKWPSVRYHITERNCVDFAVVLCAELRVPRPFPDWVRGGLHVARNNTGVKNVVDGIWGMVRWWNQVDEENAYVPPKEYTAQHYVAQTNPGAAAPVPSGTTSGASSSAAGAKPPIAAERKQRVEGESSPGANEGNNIAAPRISLHEWVLDGASDEGGANKSSS